MEVWIVLELCILVQLQFSKERWIVVELWFTVKLLGFSGALDRSRALDLNRTLDRSGARVCGRPWVIVELGIVVEP